MWTAGRTWWAEEWLVGLRGCAVEMPTNGRSRALLPADLREAKAMADVLRKYLVELQRDLKGYRAKTNRVFSCKLRWPGHCAAYFFGLLVATSDLYRHYLTLRTIESAIPTTPRVGKSGRAAFLRSRIDLEFRLRERFAKRLESLACWSMFHPINEFAAENRLRRQRDYVANLTLHVPEIYGETINLGRCVRAIHVVSGFSDTNLAELLVGLEHAAHHASYCRHALAGVYSEGGKRK
jgi:hypothetical protein